MKITEVIEHLQKLLAEQGDLTVKIEDVFEGGDVPVKDVAVALDLTRPSNNELLNGERYITIL